MASTILLGTIDAGGKGDELLIRAINAIETASYNLTDFAFSEPEPVTSVENPTHNTKISLAPYATTGYYGVRTIYYNRIHASKLPPIIVPWNGERYISDLLGKINSKYGIYIEPKDINDGQVPTPPNGKTSVQMTLDFKPSSIIFYSSTEIQIGQNDPTGDTSIIEDFAVDFAAVINQTESIPNQELLAATTDKHYIDFTSLAVDRYPNRQVFTPMKDSYFTTPSEAAAKRVVSSDNLQNALNNNLLPFVGMWMASSGKSFAISPIGDIFNLQDDGKDWVFVRNAFGYNLSNGQGINTAYKSCVVKAITQSANGTVYAVARTGGGVPSIFRIPTDASGAAMELSITKFRSLALNADYWDDIVIHDFAAGVDKLGIIISSRSGITYPSDSPSGNLLPAVELFNVGGDNNYYSLHSPINTSLSIELKDTSGLFNKPAKNVKFISFITPLVGSNTLDVIYLAKGNRNGTIYPIVFRDSGGRYQASIIPNANIGINNISQTDFSVAGYRIPVPTSKVSYNGNLVNDAYLEVIECVAPILANDKSVFYDKTRLRRQNGWLGYGVCVWSTVARSASTSNGWHYSDYQMSGSNTPRQITVHGNGPRQVYTVQSANAIVRTRLTQSVGTDKFNASVGYAIGTSGNHSFDRILPVACAKLQAWAPVLDLNTTITLQDSVGISSPGEIDYSFVASNDAGERVWLTQISGSAAPIVQAIPENKKYLGSAPVLTMAQSNSLLYVSERGNGIYKSQDSGASWSEFNVMPCFYRQDRPISATENIGSTAVVRLTGTSFKEGVYAQDTVLLELNVDAACTVVNYTNLNLNDNLTFNNHTLVQVKDSNTGGKYEDLPYGTANGGINLLSKYSPSRVLGWDSDANNAYEFIGDYTASAATPYAVKYNYDNYLFGIPGQLVDFCRDVRYLGFRHWILMKEGSGASEVWKLHFTNVVQPERTIGLYGSTAGVDSFPTFKPEVSFHLWDYEDSGAGYIPYVFYGEGRVLILERIDNTNNFAVNLRNLVIPNDNGNPLVPVRMYTANRRDYYFFQKGNGVFKLTYEFQDITSGSNVTLSRTSNLNSALLRDYVIENGCKTGIEAKNAPEEGVIPDNLPEGADMGWTCSGTTKVRRKADGAGGYTETLEPYNEDCGYVPPPAQFMGGTTVEGNGPTQSDM